MAAKHGQRSGTLALSRGPSPLEHKVPLLGGEMLYPLPAPWEDGGGIKAFFLFTFPLGYLPS